MSYQITNYTKNKARKIGVSVTPSSLPQKKIDVWKDGKRIASVGAIGYEDYPTYIKTHGKEYAEKRRELYHQRHKKTSTGEYYARSLLW